MRGANRPKTEDRAAHAGHARAILTNFIDRLPAASRFSADEEFPFRREDRAGAPCGTPAPSAEAAARWVGCVLRPLGVRGLPAGSGIDAWWRRACRVAAAAELLNDRAPTPQPTGELIVAALLHDVGEVCFAACFPKAYRRICEDARRLHRSRARLERERFGLDHATVGMRLAERWRLTGRVRDGIGLHHVPAEVAAGRTPFAAFVALIQLAKALTHEERFGHPDRASRGAVEAWCDLVGIDSSQVSGLSERTRRRADGLLDAVRSGLCADPRQISAHHELRFRRPAVHVGGREETRLRCLRATAEFASRSVAEAGESALCLDMARTWAELAGIESAVAFLVDRREGVYHCAAHTERGGAADVLIAEAGGAWDDEGPPAVLLRSIVAPTPNAMPVLDRYRRVLPGPGPLMLPVCDGDTQRGGVLFDWDGCDPEQWAECGEALAALISVFGMAAGRVASLRALQNARDGLTIDFADRGDESDRARSLATISETAAGAAHELNTPLAVISGRAQMLLRDADRPEQREALEIIRAQTEICTDIVGDLVAFANPPAPKPAVVALETWLRDVQAAWCRRNPHPSLKFEVRVADPAIRLRADLEQLQSAIDALLRNALDAAPKEGARVVINSPSRASDETVVIAVEDNGRGMTGDVLERACDPFFSRRPAGRSRGLGLSRAARLVEINGGRLWIESAPDAGTTVFVELPAHRS